LYPYRESLVKRKRSRDLHKAPENHVFFSARYKNSQNVLGDFDAF
jgi:hypothetical protein